MCRQSRLQRNHVRWTTGFSLLFTALPLILSRLLLLLILTLVFFFLQLLWPLCRRCYSRYGNGESGYHKKCVICTDDSLGGGQGTWDFYKLGSGPTKKQLKLNKEGFKCSGATCNKAKDQITCCNPPAKCDSITDPDAVSTTLCCCHHCHHYYHCLCSHCWWWQELQYRTHPTYFFFHVSTTMNPVLRRWQWCETIGDFWCTKHQ